MVAPINSSENHESDSETSQNKNVNVNALSSSAAMVSVIKQKRRARAYGSHDTNTTDVGDDTDPKAGTDSDPNVDSNANADATVKDTSTDAVSNGGTQEETSDGESIATVDTSGDGDLDMFNVDDLEQINQDEEDETDGDDNDMVQDDEAVNVGEASSIAENDDDEINGSACDIPTSKQIVSTEENQYDGDSDSEVVDKETADATEDQEDDQEEHEDEAISDQKRSSDAAAYGDADSTTSETPDTNFELEELQEGSKAETTIDGADVEDETGINQEAKAANNQIQNAPTESKVTDQDILDTVDVLFSEADVETMTVKDITRSVKEFFQIKMDSERKALIKEHLIKLVNQKMEQGEEGSGSESDGEIGSEGEGVEDDEQSEYGDSDDEVAVRKSKASQKKKKSSKTTLSKSRPKRTPKKRKPSHLKIHHESLRKRQIAQAKIRAEEMQQRQQNQLSEVDRERAEAIAKKFQTDSEEMRLKRMEDRMGLLKLLEYKKLMLLDIKKEDEKEGGGVSLETDQEILGSNTIAKSKVGQEMEVASETQDSGDDSDGDSTSDSESDSEDELEFIPSTKTQQNTLKVSTTKEELKTARKTSPTSVIQYFSEQAKVGGDERKNSIVKNKFLNPRASLRNALRVKQFQQGNAWLAR